MLNVKTIIHEQISRRAKIGLGIGAGLGAAAGGLYGLGSGQLDVQDFKIGSTIKAGYNRLGDSFTGERNGPIKRKIAQLERELEKEQLNPVGTYTNSAGEKEYNQSGIIKSELQKYRNQLAASTRNMQSS
jgi:hypothetical protein